MIEQADVLVLSHRLSSTRFFSTGSNVTRDSVLVRIRDRDGLVGWGETYLRPGAVEAAREMAELITGGDPERAAQRLERSGVARHRWALGAVSMAVDDLQGRRRGVSVAELYGVRIRERVRAYASSAGYVSDVAPADAWTAETERVAAAGFRAMKLRIGRYPLDDEVPAIERTVDTRPDFVWMADGNGAYTLDESRRLGAALADLGFRWLEEPLPTGDRAASATLAAELDIAVAGGEMTELPEVAAEAIRVRSFDIVQPDLSICGGMAPALRIAAHATRHGIACIPHACNGAVSLAATLQVLAVLPGLGGVAYAEPMLEHDVGENPLRSELLGGPIPVRDGWIDIPSGPGLGIDVDEEAVRRYAVA